MMKTIISLTLGLLTSFASVSAQSCSGFEVTANTFSFSVRGGLLHAAPDGSQYPAYARDSPSIFDISSNGSLSFGGAQCSFSPYLRCGSDVNAVDSISFSISEDNRIVYGGESQFLVCPIFALDYEPASSLPTTTTLTVSTQITSGSARIPTATSVDVPVSFIFTQGDTAFVRSPGSCTNAVLASSICNEDTAEEPEATPTSENKAAQRTAVIGGILGSVALVGAFLL